MRSGVARCRAGFSVVAPTVHAADQALAVDVAIGEENAAMQTAPVEDRHLGVGSQDYKIDTGHQRVRGFAILEVGPRRNLGYSLGRFTQAVLVVASHYEI